MSLHIPVRIAKKKKKSTKIQNTGKDTEQQDSHSLLMKMQMDTAVKLELFGSFL